MNSHHDYPPFMCSKSQMLFFQFRQVTYFIYNCMQLLFHSFVHTRKGMTNIISHIKNLRKEMPFFPSEKDRKNL